MAGRLGHSGGRNRTGRHAKIISGTFRKDRDRAELQVAVEWPEPPAFLALTTQQDTIWRELGRHSTWHAAGDWPAVWALVSALDGLLVAQEERRAAEGEGRPAIPNTKELRFLDRIYKFATVNGFTPMDRSRMPATGDVGPVDPLAKFVKRSSR